MPISLHLHRKEQPDKKQKKQITQIKKKQVMALKITDGNYKEYLAGDKLVVIDLWAEWCGPCRSIGPSVEELAEEYEGRVIIGKYNVDDEAELSIDYKVRSVPTLLFFKKGELVDKIVGAAPKAEIKARIEANL